jgi:alpha-1,2-mannosyltransferase
VTARARRRLLTVGAAAACWGAASIVIYAIYFVKNPWQDWMVYYGAVRAWFDGDLPLLYDAERFTAYLNAVFAEWLSRPLSLHPWLYPPHYLLLLAPFGLLPFAAACVLFLAASFALLAAAIWWTLGAGHRRWVHLGALVLAPATAFNIGSGQNAFLTGGLIIGGFGLLPTRPWLAGALFAVLTCKPQLCLLVPVALISAREWRALASAALTAGALVTASAAIVGIEPWRAWIEWFASPPAAVYREWIAAGRLHGQSVYTVLALLGAPHAAATVGQALATILSAACVWWSFSRPMPRDLRLAVLLAATVLAAPHVTNYDAVLLVVAAALVFTHGLEQGFSRGSAVLPFLVWAIQLFDPPMVFRIGLITPLLTMLLIACAMLRGRGDSMQQRTVELDDASPAKELVGRAER